MKPDLLISALSDGFRQLTPQGAIEIHTHDAGEVFLPSGQLIACDPGQIMHENAWPAFTRTLTPGNYPVRISVAHFEAGGERVAQAAMLLDAAPPVRFELATRPGEDVARLEPGESFAHGVDSGTSCFVDQVTAAELFERCKDWDYCHKGGFGEAIGINAQSHSHNSVFDIARAEHCSFSLWVW